jgi:hypothetical protein
MSDLLIAALGAGAGCVAGVLVFTVLALLLVGASVRDDLWEER